MRLLNTLSLKLQEFWDDKIPLYAILSHTWEKEEVSFQDMQGGAAKRKAGYVKIAASCNQAARAGLSYVWIDTCCIDKSSSAELTEAINSMYRWYQNADICYAYLADVLVLQDGKVDSSAFAKSKWFTRGWTLQELIAPSRVTFYSRDWKAFGSKMELKAQISEITGIDVRILEGQSPQAASVAARMFWASKRVTTRVEDMAYCLMGLFGVNMPLLYGEAEKAFIRLQEEIMKVSNDHSLFAWRERKLTVNRGKHLVTGLLANSPVCFIESGNIVPTMNDQRKIPFATSNLGLRIELVLVPRKTVNGLSIAVLDCIDSRDSHGPVGIQMQRLDDTHFVRTLSDTLYTVPPENRPRESFDTFSKPRSADGLTLYSQVLYVQQRWDAWDNSPEYSVNTFSIAEFFNPFPGPVYFSVFPENQSSWSFGLKSVAPFESWTSMS